MHEIFRHFYSALLPHVSMGRGSASRVSYLSDFIFGLKKGRNLMLILYIQYYIKSGLVHEIVLFINAGANRL
jgi:hypothetical protein